MSARCAYRSPQRRGYLAEALYPQSYRWIFLTVIDVVTEVIIIAFPVYALWNVKFRERAQKWKLNAVIILGRCRSVFAA